MAALMGDLADSDAVGPASTQPSRAVPRYAYVERFLPWFQLRSADSASGLDMPPTARILSRNGRSRGASRFPTANALTCTSMRGVVFAARPIERAEPASGLRCTARTDQESITARGRSSLSFARDTTGRWSQTLAVPGGQAPPTDRAHTEAHSSCDRYSHRRPYATGTESRTTTARPVSAVHPTRPAAATDSSPRPN